MRISKKVSKKAIKKIMYNKGFNKHEAINFWVNMPQRDKLKYIKGEKK